MKKRKPTKADLEAMASYQALQRKWDAMPKFARGGVRVASCSPAVPALTTPPGRETPHYPSLTTPGQGGGTKPVQSLRYTGTKMIGIGTLHKSNAVPVFSDEEAIAMAQMRRN